MKTETKENYVVFTHPISLSRMSLAWCKDCRRLGSHNIRFMHYKSCMHSHPDKPSHFKLFFFIKQGYAKFQLRSRAGSTIKRYCLCELLSVKQRVANTSMASLSDPASRKKAADCSKRCFPSREKAFFKAAFRHRSSLKLFLKNWVIFSSCWDLKGANDTSQYKG